MQGQARFDAAFVLFFTALAFLASIHYLAMSWSLYWIYPWFDIPIHAIGGAVVALGSQSSFFGRLFPLETRTFIRCIALVMAVGISWEVFEWQVGIIDSLVYLFDTGLDLCMDFLGGVLGYVIASVLRSSK